MYDLAEMPDVKCLLIVNSVTEIAIAETRNLRYTIPANVLLFLESILAVAEAANNTINSLKVDGVEQLFISTNVGTTQNFFIQSRRSFSTVVNTSWPFNWLPCRREILINVTNTNAAANDLTVKIWAYAHNDVLEEFLAESVVSIIQPTT